jgi:benzoyl-CoA 2,3-epoxidase subunit B
VKRWNRLIAKAGHATELSLPSPRFHRSIGVWANQPVDPAGRPVSREEHQATLSGWLPSAADRAYVTSLMQRVVEPGKMAAWIAPPDRGINNLPVDYHYVELN